MPMHAETQRALPYPRALCLKTLPTDACSVPTDTIHAGRLHYVPVSRHATVRPGHTIPVRTIFFIERNEAGPAEHPQALSVAEAAARLYSNTLNALAHPGLGLDAAMQIARRATCYRLSLGSAEATVAAIQAVLR